MEKVILTEFFGRQTRSREMPSFEWHTALAPDFLATEMVVQPNKLSIRELSDKIAYMDEQGLKGLEEERRLAYVGITRAEEVATITFAITACKRRRRPFLVSIPRRRILPLLVKILI